ncbi:hephaestin-like protein [Trichonephila clavata]|uniref:Hephaestin-like protein n=1 Tax=Trichonephila clavata TaxID=2740835 RepID=A0A8X6HJB0_TRICU|nr:hephaestin-like protein [Trichonephila clavata]
MKCFSWWTASSLVFILWSVEQCCGQFFPDPRWTSFMKKDSIRKPGFKKHHESNIEKYLRKARNVRHYYVAAIEVDWDYAPGGNLLGERAEELSKRYFSLSREPLRLGKVYKKAIFREFTDETYTVMKAREPWQGILGPTIRGEVGDMAIIHFYNNASMLLSMHPHGSRYIKVHEGALYEDNTDEWEKVDDRVPPGGHHSYHWFFIPEDGPTPTDPDCLTWMYHSHRNADTDIHAGLLGPLIVCRPGTLDLYDRPKNVDRSFALVFMIFDENDSLYIDENIDRLAPNLSEEERAAIKRDINFRRSNMMFSVNGLSFGNLQGLDMCLGDKVGWHIVGMGNEVDVHSISFESQVFTVNGMTTDIISVFPAKFTTSLMITSRVGTFPFRCEVGLHGIAGMESTFTISQCPHSHPVGPVLTGITREYYIAAEEVEWDYGPSGINKFNGLPLVEDKMAAVFFERNDTRIGGTYRKVVYREYKDSSFSLKKIRGRDEAHLAMLGPTLRGEVGDMIKIVFLNKASKPYNLHTHGAYYTPDNMAIQSGMTRTYNWAIAEQYGPTPTDPECLTWRYYSNVDVERDMWDGLSGNLLTCRPGTLNRKGKQKYVDHEFALLFSVMDESQSHYLRENILEYTYRPDLVNTTDPMFIESNQMHSINGRVFGNLEGLRMCVGDKISWHVATYGKAIDLHTPYFHGNTFQIQGRFRDTINVAPSTHYTVVMHADNPGTWALDCRVNNHFAGGMRAIYHVEECGGSLPHAPLFYDPKKVREYYIAAIEVEWDYAPINRHIVDGSNLLENEESRVFVANGPDRIGRIYKKVVYREFTDSSFTRMKPRTRDEQHLEIMGPFIRAEVGELLRVVFKNMASRPYNIHPHGVLLQKYDVYDDAVGEDEGPVNPGETHVYEWSVPERAGPGRNGFNCSSWAYYSTVDVVKDTNAGLIGPLITCKPGTLTSKGKRRDMDHEFAVLFTIFDENRSWYIKENTYTYAQRPETVNPLDPGFILSNRMHAINGKIYGSLEGLVARRNTLAAWYMIGMGTEVDMHTGHFHGQTFLRRTDSTRRSDVVYLFPGVFETVEMIMDNPGTWFLHCHVDDHMRAGMAATYTVER